ncbi:hypothetical protein J6S88_01865 [bacterium]|nr:hypothetical protein [bacterium]
MIRTTTIKIKKTEIIDNDYIENSLKNSGYTAIRWAITDINNSEITLTVSYSE